MKHLWIKLLLLATFAFWASGAAKYVHESMEHHGHDASIDDDDDDSPAITVTLDHAGAPDPSIPKPLKKPCPVCQMLGGMIVDRSAPPVMLTHSTRVIDIVEVINSTSVSLHHRLMLTARGPPVL